MIRLAQSHGGLINLIDNSQHKVSCSASVRCHTTVLIIFVLSVVANSSKLANILVGVSAKQELLIVGASVELRLLSYFHGNFLQTYCIGGGSVGGAIKLYLHKSLSLPSPTRCAYG